MRTERDFTLIHLAGFRYPTRFQTTSRLHKYRQESQRARFADLADVLLRVFIVRSLTPNSASGARMRAVPLSRWCSQPMVGYGLGPIAIVTYLHHSSSLDEIGCRMWGINLVLAQLL